MPPHGYERVPLEEDAPAPNPQNVASLADFPTTAPLSFHTADLHSSPLFLSQLPHRNDETAATFIPHNQRPSPTPAPRPQTLLSESVTEDGGMSIWAPSEPDSSEEGDLNAMQEDILVRLRDRMEAIEKHFATNPMIGKQEIDLEEAKERKEAANKKRWTEFWIGLSVALFMIWWLGGLGAFIVLHVWPKHGGGEGSN
ncbi:hypothetical protein F5882DRAFT_407449 [Hyaloscypha sp. PMI_1271]|nr:hypothetical protein F5882DRAFT_407449 [Hyaloscypha sp. PMI_1271]